MAKYPIFLELRGRRVVLIGAGAVAVRNARALLAAGARLVVVAERIDYLEILCNVVDEPELCDFFVPAVVRRGDLQIAIGTEGQCPAYAGRIRKKLEQTFTDKHGQFLAELEALRKRIMEDVPDAADRKALLGQLADDKSFEYFVQNGPPAWQAYADELISMKNLR
jgi:precorrin-2 dehydrogenase/sirohydrochlorin ferrochelatase